MLVRVGDGDVARPHAVDGVVRDGELRRGDEVGGAESDHADVPGRHRPIDEPRAVDGQHAGRTDRPAGRVDAGDGRGRCELHRADLAFTDIPDRRAEQVFGHHRPPGGQGRDQVARCGGQIVAVAECRARVAGVVGVPGGTRGRRALALGRGHDPRRVEAGVGVVESLRRLGPVRHIADAVEAGPATDAVGVGRAEQVVLGVVFLPDIAHHAGEQVGDRDRAGGVVVEDRPLTGEGVVPQQRVR